MKLTTNLNLKKPDYTDPVDIEDINSNMDIIDNAIQNKVDNTRVLTDVPSGAKFTDTTYSEITTAEIDTGTASTLRTITGRRVKYILDKVQGWIVGLTKSDVGLSNVDNVKQASKAEFDTHNVDTTKHISDTERAAWSAKETTTGSQAKADAAEQNAKTYADAGLADKVDKVSGKGLSTNDYTTTEKNKLNGIEAGAQVNTVTSVNGQTGDIELTGDDIDYFDNDISEYSSVEGALNSINDTIYAFMLYVIGAGYDMGNDPTLGELVEMFTTVLGDYELGVAPSLGEISNYLDGINMQFDEMMPLSGGTLENYREKLSTVSASGGSINLSLGNVFVHTPSGNRTYSITNAVSGQAHSFTLIINMGSTVRTLTFPASVKWQGGEIPDMSETNKSYVLTFVSVDGGTNWLGMFGGEF